MCLGEGCFVAGYLLQGSCYGDSFYEVPSSGVPSRRFFLWWYFTYTRLLMEVPSRGFLPEASARRYLLRGTFYSNTKPQKEHTVPGQGRWRRCVLLRGTLGGGIATIFLRISSRRWIRSIHCSRARLIVS